MGRSDRPFSQLDRYGDSHGPIAAAGDPLRQPTARAVAEAVLSKTVDILSSPRNPRGCLLIQGSLACGADAEPIRKELISRRKRHEALLRMRFERSVREGDLPSNLEPADLARYIATANSALSVQAANGAGRADLLRGVKTAMRAWPAQ